MDLKTAFFVLMIALAYAHLAFADANDYTVDFPTSDANHKESVLIICNMKTNVCTKEVYKNDELVHKTYDKTKATKALERIEDVQNNE